MSDLDFGMNQWMTKPFNYPDKPMDRGKVLWEQDLEKLSVEWGRYLDVDGDGIGYRTLPGNKYPGAAYFTRGTGHNEYGRYTEDPVEWEKNLLRLKNKMETVQELLPKPEIHVLPGAEIGIIGFGSTDPAIREALEYFNQQGVSIDYLRLRALPAAKEVKDFIDNHPINFVVELNRDGQLRLILQSEFPDVASRLQSLAHLDGLPLSVNWLVKALQAQKEIK